MKAGSWCACGLDCRPVFEQCRGDSANGQLLIVYNNKFTICTATTTLRLSNKKKLDQNDVACRRAYVCFIR